MWRRLVSITSGMSAIDAEGADLAEDERFGGVHADGDDDERGDHRQPAAEEQGDLRLMNPPITTWPA